MIVSVLSNCEFRSRLRRRGAASLGVTIAIGSALVISLFATDLEAADRHHKHRPAEIWHGSKLVVPSPPAFEATHDDDVAQPDTPAARDLPEPTRLAIEHLPPTLQELPVLRLPPRDQPINSASLKTSEGDTIKATTAPLGKDRSSTAAIPQISFSGDPDYEIYVPPGSPETFGSTEEQTAVQPLSFHFTIEEKKADHRHSAPDQGQSTAELAVASNPSAQEANISPNPSADAKFGSAIRWPGVLLSIATFFLGLLSLPLILGVCASVYLRRTAKNGPLIRVELVNPAGGEQPYHVGLARVRLSGGTDAAESARQETPSMSSHRHGTVLDEPLPITPIGPTYDEQKRQEEEQRRELEEAMLREAFLQNIELRQKLATDSGA